MASSADIVFLIDATGSMRNVIDGLKNNLKTFFHQITTGSGQDLAKVRDWRAKIVGFRDAQADKVWFEEYPFTTDVATLEKTLDELQDVGGGDTPESLLDAIYTLAVMPETNVQETPEPNKWRGKYQSARFIIAFTDAMYKDPLTATAPVKCAGLCVDDVVTAVENASIRLCVVHPTESEGVDMSADFEVLANARNAMDMPTVDASGNEIPLNEFAQSDRFEKLLELLGRTVTKAALPTATA